MAEAIMNYYILDGSVKEVFGFSDNYDDTRQSVYEVIRVINGIPLYLEDHFTRFEHSSEMAQHKSGLTFERLSSEIKTLLQHNNISDINVKLVSSTSESGEINNYLFLITSSYPEEELYKSGVKLSTFKAMRQNPHAKIIYKSMRDEINLYLKRENFYETLLINDNEEITEGSRSNVFFIKDDVIYTSPAKAVLLGITREKIVDLCKSSGIRFVERDIPKDNLADFNSCFMSGTSPKILPVKSVENIQYDTENRTLRKVMKLYNDDIAEYIKNHR